MLANKLFAYTEGVTNRPGNPRPAGRTRSRLARVGRAIDKWTLDVFNPRLPHDRRGGEDRF